MRVVDWLLAIITVAFVPFAYCFARLGGQRLPLTQKLLRRCGIYFVRDHYYWPRIHFNDIDYDNPRYDFDRLFNEAESQELATALSFSDQANRYVADESTNFDPSNQAFGPVDAEMLFSFLLTQKPKKIVEIGGGHTTNIIRDANKLLGYSMEHICIEPYEFEWLDKIDEITLVREKVENVDPTVFESLDEGDLLFIDSSHMIRPNGDVLHEYLKILPSLRSGVYVHVHDIFSPYEYLEHWHKDYNLMWNEMYLLEAILLNSDQYQIVIPNYYLSKKEGSSCFECFNRFSKETSKPGSIYLRKK